MTSDGQAGQPLVAIVGLCGGAGVTTLALLLALAASRAGAAPVLVADTGGPGAGVALLADATAARSLPQVAALVARGVEPPSQLVGHRPDGVRVLASAPQLDAAEADESAQDALPSLLEQARAAHALTVVDLGVLDRALERRALAAATHVVWVLPARLEVLKRAEQRLTLLAPLAPTRQILLVRADGQSRRPFRPVATLAEQWRLPLVLMPNTKLAAPDEALRDAASALQALLLGLAR